MIRMRIESILETKPIRVMFQDEARFGRIDNPRDCWAQPKTRPRTHKQIIREYTYLYGAFSPRDGRMDCLILPHMNTTCMNIFLEEVSKRYPDEIILMVMDGAPCHNEGVLLSIPENIVILKLPPYSPQLNPAENMWDEIREKFFGNVSFASMAELESRLVESVRYYEGSQAVVRSISGWGWILKDLHNFSN